MIRAPRGSPLRVSDPATYLAAIAGFALVATVASAVPARAATRVDPIETLRLE